MNSAAFRAPLSWGTAHAHGAASDQQRHVREYMCRLTGLGPAEQRRQVPRERGSQARPGHKSSPGKPHQIAEVVANDGSGDNPQPMREVMHDQALSTQTRYRR